MPVYIAAARIFGKYVASVPFAIRMPDTIMCKGELTRACCAQVGFFMPYSAAALGRKSYEARIGNFELTRPGYPTFVRCGRQQKSHPAVPE